MYHYITDINPSIILTLCFRIISVAVVALCGVLVMLSKGDLCRSNKIFAVL